MSVRFTGGEPLLRKDFEKLYLVARELGLKVFLFTNGTLITEKLALLFKRVPPLEPIEISLYGMKAKSYEAISRCPGSFEAAWQGIRLLLKHEVPFLIKSALLHPNRDEIEEFEVFASTIPWMDEPPGFALSLDYRARPEQREKNKHIDKLRLSPEDILRHLVRKPEVYLKGKREFCSRFMAPPGDKLLGCGAGNGGCVDAYGNLQPCLQLRHPDMLYSMRKEGASLKDGISRFFAGLRESARARNPDYLARCARCFLKGLCEQCPAKSWMEHGALDSPVDYLCRVAHVQAEYLGLVEKGEKAWELDNWKERVRNMKGETTR